MASDISLSSRPRPFTEEQISFLVYHLAIQMKPKSVCDSFNKQFSTKHDHTVLRNKASYERRNSSTQSYYLSLAKKYAWYKPEARVFTLDDEDEVDERQQISPKKSLAHWGFEEEEQRAFIAIHHARTAKVGEIVDALNHQFSTRYISANVKRYLTMLSKNQEEEERLMMVAKRYNWYQPPNPKAYAKLQKIRQLQKKFAEESHAKRDTWREAARDDPEEFAKA